MAALQAIYKVCKGCGHTYATRNLSPINSELCPTCKIDHVVPKPSQKPPPCLSGGHYWLLESPNGQEFGSGTCKTCGVTWNGFRMWEPQFSHIDISAPVDVGKFIGSLI